VKKYIQSPQICLTPAHETEYYYTVPWWSDREHILVTL
jgi:hypothetical protein